MKSKHKRYIRKHIHKETLEEIAKKLGLPLEDLRVYANKCLSIHLDSTNGQEKKPLRWLKVSSAVFSFVVFPVIIFLLAFNKNSFQGVLDALESGQYLSCINGVFQGKIPFKDFIPPVGPLFIWVLSGFLSIFGKTIYMLRMYFFISTVATYLILYFLGRQLYRFKVFTYILPVVALAETLNPFWVTRWAGYSRFGSGLLGILFLVKYVKDKNSLYLLLSGVVAGLALLYGIDSGVFLIICGVLTCILLAMYEPSAQFKENIIRVIKSSSTFLSGLAIVLIPFVVYMAFTKALVPYIEGMYLMMRYHVNAWQTSVPSFVGSFKQYNNLWLFFISDEFRMYMPRMLYLLTLPYIIYKFKKEKNIMDCVLLPLIVAYGVLSYRSGCRVVLGPQFDISLLPAILLLIYFVDKSIKVVFLKVRKSKVSAISLIISVLVAVSLSSYLAASQKRVYGSWLGWWEYQRQKDDVMPVYTHLAIRDRLELDNVDVARAGPIQVLKEEARQIEAVTKYLRDNTSEGEIFFAFPEHSLYNFLADRPAFSRFYIAVYAYTVDKWKNELLFDLQSNPPRYILYSRSLSFVAKNIESKAELLPEVAEFILDNYSLEKEFRQISIYRRKL